jgi:hypothetical protein
MTDSQMQQAVNHELGDSELQTHTRAWWGFYAAKFPGNSELTYLYTRLKMLTLLRGKLKKAVDTVKGDESVKANQAFKNVQEMIKDAKADCDEANPASSQNTAVSVACTDLGHNWEYSDADLQLLDDSSWIPYPVGKGG